MRSAPFRERSGKFWGLPDDIKESIIKEVAWEPGDTENCQQVTNFDTRTVRSAALGALKGICQDLMSFL